jgi:hypothetical protein
VTARDRCSLADATFKEAMSGMQQASAAANTIRFFTRSPRGDENDGE